MRARKPSTDYYAAIEKAAAADVAAGLVAFAGTPKPPAKKAKTRGWERPRVQQETADFINAREWKGAKPSHFVELYARLHEEVYGVEALDLKTRKSLSDAALLASRALKQFFEGDEDGMAEFMRWVWVRQANEEKQRRQGVRMREFRVTWRYQWAASLVTDYRRAAVTQSYTRPGR